MYVINLAASDLAFSLINGFPLMTVACFNKRWFWGDTGTLDRLVQNSRFYNW